MAYDFFTATPTSSIAGIDRLVFGNMTTSLPNTILFSNFATSIQTAIGAAFDAAGSAAAAQAAAIAASCQRASNLSDLASAATARTNLGLGAAATAALPLSTANGGTGAASLLAAGILTGTGGGSVSADPSSWSGTVYDVDADDIAGVDGAAVSSWTPRRDTGTLGNLTQGTGAQQPALKTGVNGINGHNVVRYSGQHYVVTAAFGAQITGDYYCASVWKVAASIGAGLTENFWKFGDAAGNGKSRALFQNGISGTTFNWGYSAGGGINTFYPNSLTCTQGSTVYLIEVIQRGARVTVYVNGAPVIARASQDYTAFTNGTLRVGYGNFGLSADVARFTLAGTIPTAAQRDAYRHYLASRYGIALSIDGGYARYTGAGVADESDAVAQSGSLTCLSHLVVGGTIPAKTGGSTGGTLNQDATATFWGPCAFVQEGGEFRFENAWSLFNTMSIRNTAPDGYGAIRFLHYSSAKEMAAFGLCPPNIFPFGGPNGSSYYEFSDFNVTSNWGDARGVQSGQSLNQLRWRWRGDSRTYEVYDETAAEPAVNGPTTGLVMLQGRPKSSVANNGTLNTNITTGATQGGMIVVKDATSSRVGIFRLDNATLTIISADAIYTTTATTAGKINVYNSSGQIQIENKTGGALNLTAAYYGA